MSEPSANSSAAEPGGRRLSALERCPAELLDVIFGDFLAAYQVTGQFKGYVNLLCLSRRLHAYFGQPRIRNTFLVCHARSLHATVTTWTAALALMRNPMCAFDAATVCAVLRDLVANMRQERARAALDVAPIHHFLRLADHLFAHRTQPMPRFVILENWEAESPFYKFFAFTKWSAVSDYEVWRDVVAWESHSHSRTSRYDRHPQASVHAMEWVPTYEFIFVKRHAEDTYGYIKYTDY